MQLNTWILVPAMLIPGFIAGMEQPADPASANIEHNIRAVSEMPISPNLAAAGDLLFALWRQDSAAFLRLTNPLGDQLKEQDQKTVSFELQAPAEK